MNDLNAYEQAYKNGYKAGEQAMLNRILTIILKNADGDHVIEILKNNNLI